MERFVEIAIVVNLTIVITLRIIISFIGFTNVINIQRRKIMYLFPLIYKI